MSKNLQILVSMICHTATFILLALGSIYQLQLLTFGSLVSLMVGLFFAKEALENVDFEEIIHTIELKKDDEEPPTFV